MVKADMYQNCINRATASIAHMLVLFADHIAWLRAKKNGSELMNKTEYFAHVPQIIDNPSFRLAVKNKNEFLRRFKQDMARGVVCGIKLPEDPAQRDRDDYTIIDFKEEDYDWGKAIAELYLHKGEEEIKHYYDNCEFVCKPFSKYEAEEVGNFNAFLNTASCGEHNAWIRQKQFLLYLKAHNISFMLVDKGDLIYAYHLVKEKCE